MLPKDRDSQREFPPEIVRREFIIFCYESAGVWRVRQAIILSQDGLVGSDFGFEVGGVAAVGKFVNDPGSQALSVDSSAKAGHMEKGGC